MSDAERQARLAEALRANLKKRKAQAREICSDRNPGERRDPGEQADSPVAPGPGFRRDDDSS